MDYMIEKIQTAIAQAIKKDPFNSENSVVEIDPETGRFYVALRKDVVEEVEDPTTQISVEDAAKYQSGITAGSVLEVALDHPIVLGHKRHALAFALDHQGERRRLHAAGGAHVTKAAKLGERQVARQHRTPNEVDVLAALAGVGQVLVE